MLYLLVTICLTQMAVGLTVADAIQLFLRYLDILFWGGSLFLCTFSARRYFLLLFKDTSITLLKAVFSALTFVLASSFTGATDLGAFAFIISGLCAVFFLFPVYVRDAVTSQDNEELYLTQIAFVFISLIGGLAILPAPTYFSVITKSISLLTVYLALSDLAIVIGVLYERRVGGSSVGEGPEPSPDDTGGEHPEDARNDSNTDSDETTDGEDQ